jgi:hypothetical protein
MSEQFTGYVKVRDGNKAPQDYGVNREVECSISFSTEVRADLEAITKEAARVADEVVNEKLGRVAGEAPKKTGGRKAADKPPAATTAASPAAIVADPAAIVEVKPAEVKQAIQTGGERVDPAGMTDDVFSSTVEARVINDNELMSAITRKNGETKNSAAIRALIGKYVPQDGKPHQASEIEASKRQGFLTELDTIPKAAV